MSWLNCSICGKYKYVPQMVEFKALDDRSMRICKHCIDKGYEEMDRAVFWLPQVDYSKVQDSISVDISKDRTP